MDGFDSVIEYGDLSNRTASHETTIRVVHSKRPVRQPSKRVDTSRYSWTPPAQSSRPVPQAEAEPYGHMPAANPAIEPLVGKIDQHMAEMGIADNRLSFANDDQSPPCRVNRANSLDMLGLRAAEEDKEILVDTFVQDDQVLWRASGRDAAKTIRKAQVAFVRERATLRAEDHVDEAALLTARLEALRKLNAEHP
jgi:hypothetical protein